MKLSDLSPRWFDVPGVGGAIDGVTFECPCEACRVAEGNNGRRVRTCAAVGATAAIAGTACAVSLTSTTLTITGPNSANTTVNYSCVAPVDPASGSYNYELTRNGS